MAVPTDVRTSPVNAPAQPPPPPPPPPQIDQNKVDGAASAIGDKLEESSFLGVTVGDVSHGDLKSINDTLAGLNPAERNAAVSRLSDEQLEKWTSELDNGGNWLGPGLSADERRDLSTNLAQGLDGAQLERVYNAFDGRTEKLELADAIATHSLPDTRVDFVQRLADNTTGGPSESTRAGTALIERGNTEAMAVAKVIGSLGNEPTALRDALGALNDDQLKAVMAGASDPLSSSSMGAVSVTYDTQPLADMINAVARGGDAEMKARVFAAAQEQLATVSGSDDGVYQTNPNADGDAAKIRDAMTNMLIDPNSGSAAGARDVVEALEAQDPYGHALTGYMQEMTATGQNKQIGNMLAELGKNVDQGVTTPVPGSPGQTDTEYPNAQLLGYFSGAVQAAIVNNGADAQTQAGIVEDIFMTVLDVANVGGTAAAVARGVGKGLTRAAVNVAVDEISRNTDALRESFYQLSFPQGAGLAEGDYRTWESSVFNAN